MEHFKEDSNKDGMLQSKQTAMRNHAPTFLTRRILQRMKIGGMSGIKNMERERRVQDTIMETGAAEDAEMMEVNDESQGITR
jgi:hypothetical protein